MKRANISICGLYPAHRVIEFMHQQDDVAQSRTATFAPTGDEHNFPGTQDFVMEQRAGNPCVSRLAEDKIVNIRIIVIHDRILPIALPFKRTVGGELIAKRRL